ncbi:signal peptidase II [Arthrobacter zhaoxinii]|uniref:Lipoprotein signal peptidase n=2 Tax=Arthrobacter zhaoxinii TaxID=2964616 RepID=A0ABY5YW97_9MICC|nr:signal peptidase II [Arthrobacter zhaoxinii]UWX98254.1 signal peptidase II [Arthrobacter zhaoxinii]
MASDSTRNARLHPDSRRYSHHESTMTPSSPQTPDSTGPGRGRARRGVPAFIMLAAAAAAVVLDQLTKFWVVRTMTEGQVTDVLPPVLRWHFIRNPGAAFSIGTDYTWVFTIIMVLVSGFLIYLMFRVRSLAWATALGLVLGGALGNLTDRLFREPSFGQGHVVDFIAFPNFAIFNIADSCVVCGVILVCLLTLRGIGMDGVRIPSGKTDSAQQQNDDEATR